MRTATSAGRDEDPRHDSGQGHRRASGRRPRGRSLLLSAPIVLLVAGLWGGLARLGFDLPLPGPAIAVHHGPLMVLGALGTLIALERAVALGTRLALAVPAISALGALTVVLLPEPAPGQALLGLAGVGLTGVFVTLWRRQPSVHALVMGAGAALWPAAVAVWSGLGAAPAVPWLAAFLLLTIIGERLELLRLARPSPGALRLLHATTAVLLASLVASLSWPETAVRVVGITMLVQALWLLRCDLAPRLVRKAGVTRYMAVALTGGYVWLAVAGALWVAYGMTTSGPQHDAVAHAFFLGFAFSMIFGHAPVILPAVLRVDLPFHPVLYTPLVLLHLTVAVRVAADVAGASVLVQGAGLANTATLAAFGLAVLFARRRTRASVERPTAPRPPGRG